MSHIFSFPGWSNKSEDPYKYDKLADKILEHEGDLPEIIDFQGIFMTASGAELVFHALKAKKGWKELHLNGIMRETPREDVPEVLYIIEHCLRISQVHLTTLDLSGSKFYPEQELAFREFFEAKCFYWLEHLALNNNGLGPLGVTLGRALCTLLDNSRRNDTPLNLKTFSCGGNRLEDDGTIALTDALIMMGTLEELRLPNNRICGTTYAGLSEALRANKNLRVIDLSYNIFKPEGAIEIAEALPHLRFLEIVDFTSCRCDDPGALALTYGLNGNRDRLHQVIFKSNNITTEALVEIAKYFIWEEFKHIRVDLSCNMLGANFEYVKEAFKTYKRLTLGSKEDDEGVEEPEEVKRAAKAEKEEAKRLKLEAEMKAERDAKRELVEIKEFEVDCDRVVFQHAVKIIPKAAKVLIHAVKTKNHFGEDKKKAVKILKKHLKRIEVEFFSELTEEFYREIKKEWVEQKVPISIPEFFPILTLELGSDDRHLLNIFDYWTV